MASPTPAYLNAEVQALSERLERARERRQNLRDAGIATDEVDSEILGLRRQLREGGQLRAGDALGDDRYLLVKPVGRGGFAVVWEAFDRAEQRRVAIKVLHQHLAGESQRRERFFRGARVMMNLKHPAVVRVYDPRGEDEVFCYFVMELVLGRNLRDAVLGQRVDGGPRLALILQVGEALAEAHKRRLVHRDVKPANILLDEQGNAKLTDFDLVGAHDTTGGTRTGALGTVVYAAPECLDKPQEVTARADVFGLGMTAIFCLSGHELSMATFRNPALAVARLDCSVPVRNVLERAVAWEPEERFADAAAMVDALRDALVFSSLSADEGARSAVTTPPHGSEIEWWSPSPLDEHAFRDPVTTVHTDREPPLRTGSITDSMDDPVFDADADIDHEFDERLGADVEVGVPIGIARGDTDDEGEKPLRSAVVPVSSVPGSLTGAEPSLAAMHGVVTSWPAASPVAREPEPGNAVARFVRAHRRGLIVLAAVGVLTWTGAVVIVARRDVESHVYAPQPPDSSPPDEVAHPTAGFASPSVTHLDRPVGSADQPGDSPGTAILPSVRVVTKPPSDHRPSPGPASARPSGDALGYDDFEDVMRKHQEMTQRCYMRSQRGADAILVGEVKKIAVLLTIDRDGNVSDLHLSDHSDDTLGRCLNGAIRSWKFRPASGGVFQFTLNFADG